MGALDPNRRTPSPPPFLAEDPDTEWLQWWRTYSHSLPVCCRSNAKDVPCKRHNPIASWIDLPSPKMTIEALGLRPRRITSLRTRNVLPVRQRPPQKKRVKTTAGAGQEKGLKLLKSSIGRNILSRMKKKLITALHHCTVIAHVRDPAHL
jgi:hypothetical protein